MADYDYIESLIEAARDAHAAGDYDRAVDCCTEAIAIDPSTTQGHVYTCTRLSGSTEARRSHRRLHNRRHCFRHFVCEGGRTLFSRRVTSRYR